MKQTCCASLSMSVVKFLPRGLAFSDAVMMGHLSLTIRSCFSHGPQDPLWQLLGGNEKTFLLNEQLFSL